MVNNKNKEVRKLILSIVCVSIFLIVMTTFVYLPKQENMLSSIAFLQNQKRFYMEDISTGILLQDATPVSDQTGLQYEPYQFKVVNNSNSDITYNIVFNNNQEKIESQGKEVLPNKYLRYSLSSENNSLIEPTTLAEDGIIYTATISAKSEVVFEFRMWLDYDADNGAMNKVFIGKIEIEEIEK
jgi:hypothetical protein